MNTIENKMYDIISSIKLLFVNLGIMGFVTFADIEMFLKILLLILTISFTSWTFITNYKNNKKKELN